MLLQSDGALMARLTGFNYAPGMLHLPRLGSAAVFLMLVSVLGAPRTAAQLITISAEGSLEHVNDLVAAPAFLPSTFSLSLSLRPDQPPMSSADPHVAIYSPLLTQCWIGKDGFAVASAEFVVERSPGSGFGHTGYLMRGELANGWLFVVSVLSSSPDFAPGFELPRTLPIGELDISHDVTLTAPGAWAAYGDGWIRSVEFVPAPEPAELGALAAAMLALVAIWRVRRARAAFATKRG